MPYPVSKMIVLSVTLSVLVSPCATLAAIDQAQPSPTVEDMNRQIVDLDTKLHAIENAPVDFCDLQAVRHHTRDWNVTYIEKLQLTDKVAKVHPAAQARKAAQDMVQESVRKVVQDFADDGDLVVVPSMVKQYQAAMKRHDTGTANTLRSNMSSSDQAFVASTERNYPLEEQLLTPIADQGDVKAQQELLKMYTWDYGESPIVPPPNDDTKAFKYAGMLAVTGNVFGQEQMAKAYACGLGTTKDPVRAYAWFNAAIAQSAVSLHTYYEPQDLLRKRDFMAASMSHDDILRARRLTVQCYKSGYKNCD
jgi:hypothetical protein